MLFPGSRALEEIDLTIDAGERVALLGPSGAGKTTLLRLLNGTLRPSRGRVELDGQSLTSLSDRSLRRVRSRVGFVHQDLSLVGNLRVSQNVLSGRLGRLSFLGSLKTLLLPSRSQLGRAHELLERVGIPEKLFERTDRLSGGQQQRVAIARTLMQDPLALLADEPVSSVDPARARDAVWLLTRICAESGITLVTSLHNLELARGFFPRLVGLRAGRVAFDRATEDLAEDEFEALYDLENGEMLADGA
ncbi:MAG: phosphonate ABC transporter ATP-binding protein [Planctomycetota bacterium]